MQTPVLILSGRTDPTDKVRGLVGGADDYLTKPFNKAELIARIQAIVRRSKGHAESVIRTGKLVVNMDARSVEVDGRRLHVTGKEYSILELLSLRKGTTLTKEMFLDHLYGGMDEPELKIIDVFICKLRKKLADGDRRRALYRDRLGPRLRAQGPRDPGRARAGRRGERASDGQPGRRRLRPRHSEAKPRHSHRIGVGTPHRRRGPSHRRRGHCIGLEPPRQSVRRAITRRVPHREAKALARPP